jgi:dTDP-4-amino-4,6-dideoxygalactose transaminase
MNIPFVKPPLFSNEEKYVIESLRSGHHGGDGPFTKKCHKLLEDTFDIHKTLLTTSCTDALEMAALLTFEHEGDEAIIPSYTFSSTALAFVRAGFKIRFIDADPRTLNIDVTKLEKLITANTRVIVAVHYAGIVAEMNQIREIARDRNIFVIEDAAQAINSKYHGKYAGSLSDLATFSFHATKSYSCGEGGALAINNPLFVERSQFLWEKGTDRSLVVQGLKNKYHWVDTGSSFLISDILAAMLLSQLEKLDEMQNPRKKLWQIYNSALSPLAKHGLNVPHVESYIEPNYHAFWIMFPQEAMRDRFLNMCREKSVTPYIGYIPLHSSPMGRSIGGDQYDLPVTDSAAQTISRLPFYLMDQDEMEYAAEVVYSCAKHVLVN